MKTGTIVLALLAGLFIADFADARNRQRTRSYRGGTTVNLGGYIFTWRGPGGVAEAIRQGHRHTGGRYRPRAAPPTPKQTDVKQKEALKFQTFPSITALTSLLVYIEPSKNAKQKADVAQKDTAQKAVQKSEAKGHHHGRKAKRASRRAARAARRK